MQRPAFRITIRSTIGQSPVEAADAAAGPFLLGAIRACRAIRISSLTIERKEVTMITFQEPTAEQLRTLQALGDTFERATTAPRERIFTERVKVEPITAEHPPADDDEPENATATAELLPNDDIADPTPMFARDEATGEWVESDRDPSVV